MAAQEIFSLFTFYDILCRICGKIIWSLTKSAGQGCWDFSLEIIGIKIYSTQIYT